MKKARGSKSEGAARSPQKPKRKKRRDVSTSVALDTRELTGIRLMFDDGVAETLSGLFSRTIEFDDTSYENELQQVKEDIYELYAQLHALFPPKSTYQINLVNYFVEGEAERHISVPETGLNKDLAAAQNVLLRTRQREGVINIERRKYLTYSVQATSLEDATRRLADIREAVYKAFSAIQVKSWQLDGIERLKITHKLCRGTHLPFNFTYERLLHTKERVSAADFVKCGYAGYEHKDAFKNTLIIDGETMVRTLRIRDFGHSLSDRAIASIRALPIPMNIALNFEPQVRQKIVREINSNIANVQEEIYKYQGKVAMTRADMTRLPPALERKEAGGLELASFIEDNDQLINYFSGYITLFAKSKDELESRAAIVKAEAATWAIDLEDMALRQEEAFIAAQPLADNTRLAPARSLTTAEGAVMIPFTSEVVNHSPKKSYCLGQDTSTKQTIFVDPKLMKSPHMWVMGMTGAGKGMTMKSMLGYACLQYPRTIRTDAGEWMPEDKHAPQWFILDFHDEYTDTVLAYGGRVTAVSAIHDTCFNPLDITGESGELTTKAVTKNSDFFLALMEDVIGRTLAQTEKSLIDRALLKTYEPYIAKKQEGRPTLEDLYNNLLIQDNDISKDIATAFEMFVKGSMGVFNGQTNVSDDRWLNSYSCAELGATFQTFAILSMIKHIEQATYRNYYEGRATYFIMEETQKLFDNEAAVRVLDDFFSEMRKYGLCIICVTQIPKRVLTHPRAQYLFDNSSIFIFLSQSSENKAIIEQMFKLSRSQADAISLTAPKGSGLVIADGVKIAMRNDIPRESELYRLYNTDPDKHIMSSDVSGKESKA